MQHTFHIPVLGLGYSIDTPLKVARFGISSVVSIVDDELTERMREFHCRENNRVYIPINKKDEDARARRITAYLNLLDDLVNEQMDVLRKQPFAEGSDICNYFELLPEHSELKKEYKRVQAFAGSKQKEALLESLRSHLVAGPIDVNIMSKVDKANFNANGDYLGDAFTDALAALRGFANSRLNSSVVISAGLNPRLYAYLECFGDFYPDRNGMIAKKVILKVSDFRSASIQAKVFAKRGIWVHEFRVESGLNCGGHAFATDGFLIGPILEEFKLKRVELQEELFAIYSSALLAKSLSPPAMPHQRVTAQGGIGTAGENDFLINHYQLDGTGWGSPFLLVPEATNVDEETLLNLVNANGDDYYLSNSSPLGVLFNSFRISGSEQQRLERIEKGRPGSPCTKKFLCSNTEFTEQPICTASREYQALKLKELVETQLTEQEYSRNFNSITEKVCLCEGLCAAVYIKNGILKPKESRAVSICPGPNLAYFSSVVTLKDMVAHIYGRLNIMTNTERPNMFINELNLYVDYLRKDIASRLEKIDEKRAKYYAKFGRQLLDGIAYYRNILPQTGFIAKTAECLDLAESEVMRILSSCHHPVLWN